MFTKPIVSPNLVFKGDFHVPARANESAGIEQAPTGTEHCARFWGGGGMGKQRAPGSVVLATEPSRVSKAHMHRVT